MNFDALKNSKIILFGKSRALSGDEFVQQLSKHGIGLSHDVTENISLIVEGRMVNPIEQDKLDELYANKVAPIIEIEPLEKWLCSQIEGDTLLMSLKLSGDSERLMGYLQNPFIDNTLFLRLLNLYDWRGEGFFDNDENRDITAALISRFYENIERNHNVQYANMGIMHLLNQSDNDELTETIALLAPLQTALKEGCENSTQKILNAIALHPNTSVKVLKQWLKKGNDDIRILIAMRHDLTLQLQEYLLNLERAIVNETLSLNHMLERQVALVLLEKFPENIAKTIRLDDEVFNHLVEYYDVALSENESLTYEMQEKLLKRGESVQVVLATNSCLDQGLFNTMLQSSSEAVVGHLISNEQMDRETLSRLYRENPTRYNVEIAANNKTDLEILQKLSTSSDIEVLFALARNEATPVALLYQFQLDSRLARAVKENASFGKHIQRDNIGWDV